MLMFQSAQSGIDAAASRQVLPAALPAGFRLQARCAAPGCGARAPVDTAPWLAQGLAGTRLERLETRLRCVCGARRARLEIVAQDAPRPERAKIYVFV